VVVATIKIKVPCNYICR